MKVRHLGESDRVASAGVSIHGAGSSTKRSAFSSSSANRLVTNKETREATESVLAELHSILGEPAETRVHSDAGTNVCEHTCDRAVRHNGIHATTGASHRQWASRKICVHAEATGYLVSDA